MEEYTDKIKSRITVYFTQLFCKFIIYYYYIRNIYNTGYSVYILVFHAKVLFRSLQNIYDEAFFRKWLMAFNC